ncbi:MULTISPECIES: HipA family kinase [Colwellia]|uniref:HipA-like kinase domain-containing protein n=1 Tax=Colwellia marinimaniae TaxID=1513592 RepID=A0ABQ0MV74_9GAMM|nr:MULTISPECIES: HipA family kinase [Colwellia]GAW95501.1 hypothetical protein MTCD1_01103 [Colwellia marinimaniae]
MINIVEVIRKMKQGQTKPFLCRGDNGKLYVVKGNSATPAGLIKEWIAGSLGKKLGLPIPDFTFVWVDESLIELDSDLRFELGAGSAFASEYVPSLQEISYSDLLNMDSDLLKNIYVFDYWIKNDDRTLTELGGNPNLFINQHNRNIVVLDHNLAFELNFDMSSFQRIHVSICSFDDNLDLLIRDEFYNKIHQAFSELDLIIEKIPEDIKQDATDFDGLISSIKLLLVTYTEDEFWEDIK